MRLDPTKGPPKKGIAGVVRPLINICSAGISVRPPSFIQSTFLQLSEQMRKLIVISQPGATRSQEQYTAVKGIPMGRKKGRGEYF